MEILNFNVVLKAGDQDQNIVLFGVPCDIILKGIVVVPKADPLLVKDNIEVGIFYSKKTLQNTLSAFLLAQFSSENPIMLCPLDGMVLNQTIPAGSVVVLHGSNKLDTDVELSVSIGV